MRSEHVSINHELQSLALRKIAVSSGLIVMREKREIYKIINLLTINNPMAGLIK